MKTVVIPEIPRIKKMIKAITITRVFPRIKLLKPKLLLTHIKHTLYIHTNKKVKKIYS